MKENRMLEDEFIKLWMSYKLKSSNRHNGSPAPPNAHSKHQKKRRKKSKAAKKARKRNRK